MTFPSVSRMTPQEREEFHKQAEARIKKFSYRKPNLEGRPKQVETLVGRKDSKEIVVLMQVVGSGGENNMHYHTKSETAWMVIRGRARFHGTDGVLAELGPYEGLLIPGGSRYWFEKFGDEDLEILQMVGLENDGHGAGERINVDTHKEWMKDDPMLTKYQPENS